MSKKQSITVGKDMEKREWLYTVGETVVGTAITEKRMELPQNIKNRTITWSTNFSSEFISIENDVSILKIYLHSHINYSIIHNNQDTETT